MSGLVLAPRAASAGPAAVVAPRRLDSAEAQYPPGGKGDATVILVVVVDANGDVTDVAVREGSPPFVDAATAAVRLWRFAPATKDDVPVAARIVATVGFHAPAPEAPAPTASSAPTPPPHAAPLSAPPSFDVSVKGEREEPSTIHIPRTETRLVAGAFGDPFKVVEALPGIAPWLSGLPYYYVRGSPPENVGYFVDGIRVPLLFHVGPGPSTIAPSLVDSVDLFPSAYPARYGRYAGAVIAGETAQPRTDQAHGDFSARIYDANAFAETPYDGGQGTVAAAARYSYTGPIISLIVPDYYLAYWDYQLRTSHRVGEKATLTVFAFGAHDELLYLGRPTFRIEYHRVDVRYDQAIRGGNIRVAWTFNHDDSLTAVQTDNVPSSAALKGPGWRLRTEADQRMSDAARVRAGADIGATMYTVDDYPAIGGFRPAQGPHTNVEGGLYADVVWRPNAAVEVVPGFRFDGYLTRQQTAWAPQPRLATRVRVLPRVTWISAMGTAHEEPTAGVFVPGKLPDPIDQAAQTVYQFSEGAELRLPSSMKVRVTGFYSRLMAEHILGTDRTELGQSGGVEVFLHRDFTQRLGGFVSYTVARTVGTVGGVTERVSWDRTHVLSVVGSYDLGRNWHVGGRLFFESGRPYPSVCVQNCSGMPGAMPVRSTPPGDLPAFWRLDARLEKRWLLAGGRWLAGSLECFNTFDRAEPVGARYVAGQGVVVESQSPIILPTIGVEGGF